MPDVVTEATPGRAADLSAEQAYLDTVSASFNAPANEPVKEPEAKPTDTTPKPTADAKVEPVEEDEGTDEEAEPEGAAAPDDDEEDDTAEFPAVKPDEEDEFADALDKAGVTVNLDDITDPVARKLVETKYKDLQKGFTRAMQEARTYRKEEIQFRAEQRFQKEHRDDFIVSMLLEDPDLGERVNAKLDEMASPTARKAHEVVTRDARAQARTAEEAESAKAARRFERGVQVESYAMRAAQKAGVPYELGVGETIYALVVSRGDDGDVTRAEVDQIIREKAEKYQRSIRAHKREDRKKYIAAKGEDAKNAGLKVKPGAGAAPGIGKKPVPANEDEFVASVLAQM